MYHCLLSIVFLQVTLILELSEMIFDINIIGDSRFFFIHKYVVLILIPISISKLLSESLAPTSRFVPQPRKKHEGYVNIFCNTLYMQNATFTARINHQRNTGSNQSTMK